MQQKPQLPNIKLVDNAINEIKDYTYKNVKELGNERHYKETKDFFLDNFGGLFKAMDQANYAKFNFPLYRVRFLNTFDDLGLITEHSYPPINKTSLGRCNYPSNPVFYCSMDPFTAILETLRKEDEARVCISVWKNHTLDSNKKYLMESYLQSELHESNPANVIKNREEELVLQLLKDMEASDEEIEGTLAQRRYFHDAFIKDRSYNLSSFIAYNSLYKNFADVLMYPSVQAEGRTNNFAIAPNFADNHLRIERCYIGEVNIKDRETGKVTINFSHKAILHGNRLKTIQFNPEDEDFITDFGFAMKN